MSHSSRSISRWLWRMPAAYLSVRPVACAKRLLFSSSSRVAAAILDFNLSDGDVGPVLQLLIDRDVPVIVQTGVAVPSELRSRYPGLIVLAKPVRSEVLLAKLIALLSGRSGDAGEG